MSLVASSPAGPRGRHGRLELDDVRQMLEDRSCSMLSLDLFDTILWRRVPRPTDLFALLGERLRAEGAVPGWLDPFVLRHMRITAETDARKRRPRLGKEVSLVDIWRQMPAEIMLEGDVQRYVEAEVDAECAVLMPDLDIAALIATASDNGVPIVVVSDTYFLQEHLDRFLDRPELAGLKSARFFRSHEHGHDKKHGLWKTVLAEVDPAPGSIVHIGDHETADLTVPRKQGLRTVHFTRIAEPYDELLEREGEPLELFGAAAPRLDLQSGDYGLTSMRAKVLEGADLDALPEDQSCAWRYGAAVLGPVLTGFAEWVARRAHEEGVCTVFSPMREGEMLSALINRAARANDWDVTARPVWLSRHVTSLAALGRLDQDSVHEFVRSRFGITVGGLLETLELGAGDVPALAGRLDVVVDNGVIADDVADALVESARLRDRITQTAAQTRDRMIRHLQREGALDGADLFLVDLGWGGTIQANLSTALQIADIDTRPVGLYLATDVRSVKYLLRGLRMEGYLGEAGEPAYTVPLITRSPEVIEQGASSLCGSLLGFDADAQPVLGTLADPPSQVAARRALHDGIHAFQRQWTRYAEALGTQWPALDRDAAPRLANILVSAVTRPTLTEAAMFGRWEHEDNFGSEVVTTVVPGDLAAVADYLSPADLDELQMRDAFWPQALAGVDPVLARSAALIAADPAAGALFEPAEPIGETVLRYKTGDGRWHYGPRVPVRINRNGLSFARLNFEAFDVSDISLAIPGRPAIVRVDRIAVTVTAGGHRRPEPLIFETADDFSGLVYAESEWLGGNLVEFHSESAALWLPLQLRAGAPVSTGQVTITFAVLPQSLSGLSAKVPPRQRVRRLIGRTRSELADGGPLAVLTAAGRVARRAAGGEDPERDDREDDDHEDGDSEGRRDRD